MQTKHKEAWIDFTDFGYEGYLPISVFEMELLLAGAERMLEDYDAEAAELAIDKMCHDLWLTATTDKITHRWVTKAAMLIALRGLQGNKIPDIVYLNE